MILLDPCLLFHERVSMLFLIDGSSPCDSYIVVTFVHLFFLKLLFGYPEYLITFNLFYNFFFLFETFGFLIVLRMMCQLSNWPCYRYTKLVDNVSDCTKTYERDKVHQEVRETCVGTEVISQQVDWFPSVLEIVADEQLVVKVACPFRIIRVVYVVPSFTQGLGSRLRFDPADGSSINVLCFAVLGHPIDLKVNGGLEMTEQTHLFSRELNATKYLLLLAWVIYFIIHLELTVQAWLNDFI